MSALKTIMAVAAVGLLGGALSACVSTRGPSHHRVAPVIVHDSGYGHHGRGHTAHRGPGMSSHHRTHTSSHRASSHRARPDDHKHDHRFGDHH
jgi:hypothetical protein